ncbi:MAG: hypothetical protein GF308_17210 [Candidatus Heimdallarchaeota archaeon]|nr:hypothetical protein [Candidatus Heimdallarchaeota archaeon]
MALQTNGLIIPKGLMLPVRLYHINGDRVGSKNSIMEKLAEYPVEFKQRKYYEGFSEIDSDGKMISAIYTIGQPVNVQRLKDQELTRQVVYSHGQCEYIFHIKGKFLECRGASWVVKKGLNILSQLLEADFNAVRLDESAMVSLCRDAALVKAVDITDLDNPALQQIQLKGEILDSAEWTIYRRQGVIRYFRGLIDLPTGGQISAQISNKGSMLIYKRGDGIPAEDLIATIDLIMKMAV